MDGLTATKASPSISDPQDAVTTVVNAVADERGQSPLELEPLAHVLDPVVLEKIVDGDDASSSRKVEFEYAGCEVTVTGDGRVTVAEKW